MSQTPVKDKIQGILHPKKSSLPAGPPVLLPPQPVIPIEDDYFSEIAHSSEFRRLIYKVLYGKVHRTEKQHGNLEQKVKIGLETLRELGRGTKQDFRDVIKELKKVLAERKVN